MTEFNSSLSGQTASLVLGSGGARGLAHIGVIRALEDAGVEIRTIAGSSMGALIGGIHAAGRLDAYEEWVCGLAQSDVLKLVDWTLSGGGLIRGSRIVSKLGELIGEYEIEDLDIDFTAVAVDLDSGRELWLDRGPLFDAIRASIAIPGVFTPHEYRGRTMIDGGILNPVPIAPTLRAINDLVIVVDVNAPAVHPAPLARDQQADEDRNGMFHKVREFMNSWRDSEGEGEGENGSRPGPMAVMMRALDTMEAAIARHHMAIFHSDIMISVPKNTCQVHEFYRAREIIDLGRCLAQEVLSGYQPNRSNSERTTEKNHGQR